MNSNKLIDEEMNESDDSYSNDEKSEDEEEEESRPIGKTDESMYKTEDDVLLDILVNKSKNVTELHKFFYSKLAREYIEASDSKEAREYKEASEEKDKKRIETRYSGRIKNLLSKVPTNDRLDTDTKVKLLFVFSVSIERDFLMKLRENAAVKLDNTMRITEYKQTGGGLELKGTHKPKKFINDREKKMLDFLSEQCLLLDSPPTMEWLAENFKKSTGSSFKKENLAQQMRDLRKKIYETEYDIQLRVRMLFITSARLQSVVLQELRKDAQVEVDEENRITKYEANDGSLSLRGDHSNSSKGLFGFDHKRQRLLAESNKKKDDSGNKENDEDSKKKTKKGYAFSDGEEPEKMKTSAIVKMNSGNKKDNEDEGRRERQARREIKRQSDFPDNEDDGAGEKKENKKKRKIVDKEIEVKEKRRCERRPKVEISKEKNSGDQSAISTSSDGAKEDDDSPLHSIDTTDSENGNLQSQHRQKDGKVQIPDKNKKVQRSENRLKELIEMERGEQEDEEEHAEEVERSVSRSLGPLSDEFSYEPQEPHVEPSEDVSEENERKEDAEEVPSQEEDQDSDDSFIDVATVNPEDQFYEIEDVQEDSGSDNDSTQDLNESLIDAITVDHQEDDSESEAPPIAEEVQVFAVPRIPKNRRAIFRSAQGSFPKRIQKTPEDPPCSTKLINESAIPDVSKRVHPKFRSMSVAEIERPIQNIQKPSLPISSPLPYLSDTPISHRTHQSLLTSLQSMMITLDIPIPRSMEDRIQRNIKMDDLKNKISLAELQLSIKSCFLILGRCSNSEEATISLKDFILLFRNMLITLQVPFLSDFENTLKTIFGSSSDKKVSVEKLQSALDAIISVVAP